ncbi:unnamed protein product [Clonostachys rosea]|uniref:VWFA domain-containing protein n=1 Tax=Bionectria ochroleuca TaxID=29856 RepID=A0ABY6TTX2_BIOOC|nr:unnamed protein product [Clonostachys rosea]
MSDNAHARVVGCLLDVSGSMRKALEPGQSDERATERLMAVLRTALKVAQAEQRHDPGALVFVGLFGLDTIANPGCPSLVDLCSATEAIVSDGSGTGSGHELLIALSNKENRPQIAKYIQTKLSDDEARILHGHLQRHPRLVSEFVNAIPPPEEWEHKRRQGQMAGQASSTVVIKGIGQSIFGPIGPIWNLAVDSVGLLVGSQAADSIMDRVEEQRVDDSEAIQLARRICNNWLADFASLRPRPVTQIVSQLQRLEEYTNASGENTLLDTLRRYLYGLTPMKDALQQSLAVLHEYPTAKQRVLLLVSDGLSTDGSPLPQVQKLVQDQPEVIIATVYLTAERSTACRRIYDQPCEDWNEGQQVLFKMASKVSIHTHPIPVLATIGWGIPSSGTGALYATVCSAAVLDEFCSILISARFGTADALLRIIGSIHLDKYIDDRHVRTRRRPSDQKYSPTCYAHAAAAVIHMALIRIVGRIGGYPSIRKIRRRILASFREQPGGHYIETVLEAAIEWYPPLQFRKVNEDDARQAVLHRRPVLATFFLSEDGWTVFGEHFDNAENRKRTLTSASMAEYRSAPASGGHAVVLTRCEPNSLTFLNSWGKEWGDEGSFGIEDHKVLELDAEGAQMSFYDVFWVEDDLSDAEKEAFDAKVNKRLREEAMNHPGLLELEARCPNCHQNSLIVDFKGSIRESVCPRCSEAFKPESFHLLQALYARAGLGVVI